MPSSGTNPPGRSQRVLDGAGEAWRVGGGAGVSDVASKEEYEGKRQEWDKILEGELAKARAIQDEVSGLNFREVEQAVFATFLHSQPVGHRA